MRRRPSLPARLYQFSLTAFPPDVRERHGFEMAETFSDLLEARHIAGKGSARLVIQACLDALRAGVAERIRRVARGRRQGMAVRPVAMIGRGDGMMIGDIWDDLKLTGRGLVRTPAASSVLVLTLALGIGASTAVFSVLQGVLFQPLPYEDPHEIVALEHVFEKVENSPPRAIPGPDLIDYMAGLSAAEAIGSVFTLATNLNDDQGAARITIGWITPDFFSVLAPGVAAGRLLEPSDWTPRSRVQMEDPNFQPPPMPVLLSHGLWRDRFASDPALVGQSVTINGTRMNVVGVLAEGFRLHSPASAELTERIDAFGYLPVPLTDGARGGTGGVTLARLRDGATLDQLRGEATAVATSLVESYENHARFGTRVVVTPLLDGMVADVRPLLWTLFGAVGLVLLISVINVANLMLVRAHGRRREFAIRSALGVGRGRVVRQLLTESTTVALIGAAAGLILAAWGVEALVALAPADLPRLEGVGIDGRVLIFALAVSIGSAVLFGMAPAFSSSRVGGAALLADRGGRGANRGIVRLRNALIVGELALSVVLVAGSGLLLRSFGKILAVDPGYEPASAVAVDLALPFFTYRQLEVRQTFFGQLLAEARSIPGVSAAGITSGTPLTGGGFTWSAPFGEPGDDLQSETAPRARYRIASSGYFEALGATLVEGRSFVDGDGLPGQELAVVVDQALAERAWPGESAVGRSADVLVAGYIGPGRQATARVVGVIRPIRYDDLRAEPEPHIWIPFNDNAPLELSVVLRGPGDPAVAANQVREILRGLDPGVPVYGVRYLTDDLKASTARNRYALMLLGLFAAVALVLAAVGLYGVISTTVQQRTREIGVRLALGAPSKAIGSMVLSQGARLTFVGLLIGLLGAVALGPVLGGLMFDMGTTDAPTLGATAAVLAVVSLAAAFLPAMRASRLDPVEALRTE